MRLDMQLAADEEAGQAARRLIRERFGDRLPAVTLYDLLTVVTELVANAVQHGRGKMIGLAIAVGEDGVVRGEVQNEGSGAVRPRPINFGKSGALGLHIVEAVAARWSVLSDGVTRVSFELHA